jgi:C4-dicarboxylate-specific signal transduction histidine kinase
MTFAYKILLGSIASLLIGSFSAMYFTHISAKAHLREEFAQQAESSVEKLSKLLSNYENEQQACEFLKQLSLVGDFTLLALKNRQASICQYGSYDKTEFNLANVDSTIESLESTKVYLTYGQVDCHKKGCVPLELEAGFSFAKLEQNLEVLWLSELQVTLAQLFSATLFLAIFAFLVKRRLEALSEACIRIQNGAHELKLKSGGNDEIAKIGKAMQAMAISLHAAAIEKDLQRSTSQHVSKMTALGEMAAGVAHEINNPLMIISGKAQQVLKKIREGQVEPREFEQALEKIQGTTNRIAKIVSGLRTFSRNGTGDPMQPTLLKTIITDTADLCGEKFRNNNVTFEIGDIPTVILQCRAVQISQVLLNLLNNSFDAVQPLPARWIKLSVESKDDTIKIRVTDSGSGIPPETAEKMMQPFYTTKEIGKGTGLGLSVSNGIVAEHGGKLFYELNQGHTSFVIQLPTQTKQVLGKSA